MKSIFLVTVVFFACTYSLPLDDEGNCKCDWRYYKHYEAKNCTPVYDEASSCKCPKSFKCPEIILDDEVCKLNGNSYPLGSKVNSTNKCQICDCRKEYGGDGKASIQCIGIECGSGFRPIADGCYFVYENNQCCPTVKCGAEPTPSDKVCTYNKKDYKLGQRIYPEEDPCLTCLCTENWTGVSNTSCQSYNCELEKDVLKLARKCIPIYHEKTCCPIEYHCPEAVEETSPIERPSPSTEDDKCYYNGKPYGIGEELDIKHPTNCVTCTCQSPPDFTCIHRSCPGPPNGDYDNCQSQYKPGACCAEYDCTIQKGDADKI